MEELDEKNTFELIEQIVTGVRRHQSDTNGLGAVLAEISRVTSRWQPDTQPTEHKSKVLFALNPETSEWAMAGIDPAEVKSWEMIGFTPSYALRWRNANLNLAHALKWSNMWNLSSLDPNEIAKWENSGAAVAANTIAMWLNTDVSTERAIAWTLAGGSCHAGRDWLTAYPDVDATMLRETEALGLSLTKARPWIDRNILGADVEEFISKGYTPSSARKYLDNGGDVTAIPDKRGDALVVGRSWKRIAKVISNNSNVTATATKTRQGGVTEVVITHKDHKHPVTIRFHKNGQFYESFTAQDLIHTGLNGRQYTSTLVKYMNLNETITYLRGW